MVHESPVPGLEPPVQIRKNSEPEPAHLGSGGSGSWIGSAAVQRRFKTGGFQTVSTGSGLDRRFKFFFFIIYSFIILITNYTL